MTETWTIAPLRARLKTALRAIGVVCGAAVLLHLSLSAARAQDAAPKAPPKGDVVMESMSTPIIRGKKITGYEHATVIIWLTTKEHAGLVCANRYALADSFLIDLHDNPIPVRNKKEAREEAEERLYQIALDVFGPRVIRRLRIEWSRTSTGGKTTIFGTFTDVQCEASS